MSFRSVYVTLTWGRWSLCLWMDPVLIGVFMRCCSRSMQSILGVLSWQWWGVVSCILCHAVKCGFTDWHMEKFLRALHTIFHNVPVRREDFCNLTKSKIFALPFCGHGWVKNLPVAERALVIWPDMMKYVEAVSTKKLPNPGTSSYDTIEATTKDPLILAKLHFFMAVCRSVTPFLTRYQIDEAVLPFIGNDLAELLKLRWIFSFYCHSDLLSSDKLGSFNNTEKRNIVKWECLFCIIILPFYILKYVYFYLFIEFAEAIHQTRTSQWMPHLSIWSGLMLVTCSPGFI